MLKFNSLDDYPPGTLFNLLCEAYEPLFKKYKLANEQEMTTEWERFDVETFTRPFRRTSVFVTTEGKTVVGFLSFDPRKKPTGIIGHNVVVPKFQQKGIGKAQIEEFFRRCKELKITRLEVSTGDHPFFVPAQKMYLSCGFVQTKKVWEFGKPYQMIYYEKKLI